MPGTVRDLNPQVVFNGTTLSQVLSFRWSLGYDMGAGEATITLPVVSGAGTYYDDVSIVVDGTERWSGQFYQWDYSFYPRSVTMQCKGRLYRASQFKLPLEIALSIDKGLLLEDLIGASGGTDQIIVQAVLDYIGLTLNGGSIGGTSKVMGIIAPEEFAWSVSDTALSYIQKIDAVSQGYRTFESAGGSIFRSQISSRPAGSPDFSFTQGVDIVEASSSRTVQDAYNAVRIGGYAVGDYLDPRVVYAEESNPFQGGSNPTRVFSWDNSMIERRAEASPGTGQSCEAMADFWLGELNREIVKVTMRTPRSDVIGPGQIHLVDAVNRIGVGEHLWVQRVDGELSQGGAFSQSMTYIGGGA